MKLLALSAAACAAATASATSGWGYAAPVLAQEGSVKACPGGYNLCPAGLTCCDDQHACCGVDGMCYPFTCGGSCSVEPCPSAAARGVAAPPRGGSRRVVGKQTRPKPACADFETCAEAAAHCPGTVTCSPPSPIGGVTNDTTPGHFTCDACEGVGAITGVSPCPPVPDCETAMQVCGYNNVNCVVGNGGVGTYNCPACSGTGAITGNAVVGASEHDNYVYFSGVSSLSFVGTCQATSGQPIDMNPIISGNSMDVKSGRKGSGDMAAIFNSGLSASNMITQNMGSSEPGALNFVCTGTLKVSNGPQTWVLSDARLAQGHYATVNNWWFASSNCGPNQEGPGLQCNTGGGSGFQIGVENEDTFDIAPM